jgi:methylmalonyl-CoA mutase
VLAAVEERYQRSQIQNAAHRYEQQIYDGTRPIIGLNRYRDGADEIPDVKLARTPRSKQQLQVDRLLKFKKKNADKAKHALDKLAAVAERGDNVFPGLLEAAEVCSLGQITGRLQEVVGRFRPMV